MAWRPPSKLLQALHAQSSRNFRQNLHSTWRHHPLTLETVADARQTPGLVSPWARLPATPDTVEALLRDADRPRALLTRDPPIQTPSGDLGQGQPAIAKDMDAAIKS